MDTSTGSRLITLSCGNGFTIDICIYSESSPGVAQGIVYVKGGKDFAGRGEWTATFDNTGHVVRVTGGAFTSTQRHALNTLIENAISIHRINF